MRDLTTIAAVEQETRKRLKDVRLAMRNKRESLARDEASETELLERVAELQHEATVVFETTRSAGLVDDAPPMDGAPATTDSGEFHGTF